MEQYRNKGITKVLGTESRGFIFGAPVALALGLPFELVRKPKITTRNHFSILSIRIWSRYFGNAC